MKGGQSKEVGSRVSQIEGVEEKMEVRWFLPVLLLTALSAGLVL